MPPQIVSGSEVHTPLAGVKIDASPFREAALAPGRVAAGIGDSVGGLFGDVAMKIQDNRNARTVFQADLAMRKTKDDFTAELPKMPDETTWLPAYKERVNSVKDQIMQGPNVGPDVRRVLEQKFATWEQATTTEIKTAALLKGVKETREDAITASTYAASQGDIEGAQNTLKAAVANYAMTEEDARKIGARFPSIAAQAQASVITATNPIKAPELIKKYQGVIEPKVFISVMAHANEARNRAQAQNVNELAMQMDESPDGSIDPDLLKEKVKSGEITQRAADGLLARMKKEKQAQAQQDFYIGAMQAHDHDFTNDKKPEETARAMKDDYAHLPEALRLRLYKDIDSRVMSAKKKGESEERPIERDMLQLMRENRMQNATTIPLIPKEEDSKFRLFGPNKPAQVVLQHAGGLSALQNMDDATFKETFGTKYTRQEILQAEQLHYATIQQKMREWFRDPANKDATTEQANAERMRLERPWVMEAVKQTLRRGAPVAVTTQEELDSLAPGTPIIFNGKIGRKK